MKPILATAITAAALVLGIGVAHADANDEQFLNTLTLNEMGCNQISFLNCGPRGEQSLIDLGKDVCAQMRKHNLSEQTTVALLMRSATKQGPDKLPIDQDKATVLVRASETAYCPDLLGH